MRGARLRYRLALASTSAREVSTKRVWLMAVAAGPWRRHWGALRWPSCHPAWCRVPEWATRHSVGAVEGWGVLSIVPGAAAPGIAAGVPGSVRARTQASPPVRRDRPRGHTAGRVGLHCPGAVEEAWRWPCTAQVLIRGQVPRAREVRVGWWEISPSESETRASGLVSPRHTMLSSRRGSKGNGSIHLAAPVSRD